MLVRGPPPGGRGEGGRGHPGGARHDGDDYAQNYFRLYDKLAGMTGTAKTEEKEFTEIYGLHVAEIPTNAGGAGGPERPHLPHAGGEVRRCARGYRRASRGRTAGACRHDRCRDPEYLSRFRRAAASSTTSSMRSSTSERRRSSRRPAVRRRRDRDEHGGRGVDIVLGGNKQHEIRRELLAEGLDEGDRRLRRRAQAAHGRRARGGRQTTRRCSSSVGCTSSARSATRRGASTTSCEAARSPGRPG